MLWVNPLWRPGKSVQQIFVFTLVERPNVFQLPALHDQGLMHSHDGPVQQSETGIPTFYLNSSDVVDFRILRNGGGCEFCRIWLTIHSLF
jgi:hypothetical protein